MAEDIELVTLRQRTQEASEATDKSEHIWNIAAFTHILSIALHRGTLGDLLGKLEQEIRIKRLNLTLGLLTVLVGYLAFGARAHFVCSLITFIIPAWIVVKSIEERYPIEELKRKWLTYWMIYNGLHLMEYLYVEGQPKMPFHWLGKTVFLLLCFTPPWNLAERIYCYQISPFVPAIKEIMQEVILELKAAWRGSSGGPLKALVWFLTTLAMYYSPYSVLEFLCNSIGFIYPVYACLIAMQNPQGSDDWMVYWLIYSAVSVIEFVHHIIWIPMYWFGKLFLLVTFLKYQKQYPGKSYQRFCFAQLQNMTLTRLSRRWCLWVESVLRTPRVSVLNEAGTSTSITENEKILCKICLTNELSITFVPCGHLACCTSCAAGMVTCPICRAPVRSIVRTYLS